LSACAPEPAYDSVKRVDERLDSDGEKHHNRHQQFEDMFHCATPGSLPKTVALPSFAATMLRGPALDAGFRPIFFK
jgi:hypothetical protein